MGISSSVRKTLHLSNPLFLREKNNQAEREGDWPQAPRQGSGRTRTKTPIFPHGVGHSDTGRDLGVEEWKGDNIEPSSEEVTVFSSLFSTLLTTSRRQVWFGVGFWFGFQLICLFNKGREGLRFRPFR